MLWRSAACGGGMLAVRGRAGTVCWAGALLSCTQTAPGSGSCSFLLAGGCECTVRLALKLLVSVPRAAQLPKASCPCSAKTLMGDIGVVLHQHPRGPTSAPGKQGGPGEEEGGHRCHCNSYLNPEIFAQLKDVMFEALGGSGW